MTPDLPPVGTGHAPSLLKVYDMLWREVATLVNGELTSGRHGVVWNAEGLPSGVYVYRLSAGSFTEAKRMLLLR